MKYDEARESLRQQLGEHLLDLDTEAKSITNLLADKLMGLDFSRTFSKGIAWPKLSGSIKNHQENLYRKVFLLARSIGITIIICARILFDRRVKLSPELSFSLVYGISREHYKGNSNIEEMGRYFDQQLEDLGLTPPDFYLVQTGTLVGNGRIGKVYLVPHIGMEILRQQVGPKRMKIMQLLRRTYLLIKISRSLPEILEIAPDFIVDHFAFANLTDLPISSLITTQSQILVLPSVFYQEKTPPRLMFWYSDNSTQLRSTRIENQKPLDYSYLTQNRIDIHLVWTNSWAEILKAFTQAKIYVAGPILFNLLENKMIETKSNLSLDRNVLVFDVTPKKSADNESFYFSKNMQKFIEDVVDVVSYSSPPVRIKLKPKRRYRRGEDLEYIRLVKSLKSKMQVLHPTQNLARIINDASLVICTPFTSPAILAKYLGRPVIYYSPSDQYQLPFIYEGIPVIMGSEELRQYVDSIMN